MKSKLFKQFDEFFEGKKIRLNQKIILFSFFLVISSILWFLIKLNDTYVASISYPVKYTNFPKNKILANDLPSSVQLKVEAHGYTLLKYKMSSTLVPVSFDVKRLSFTKDERKHQSVFYILTNYSKSEIEAQFPSEIKILDIAPDTLFLELTNLIKKLIPVQPVASYSLEKQFMLKDSLYSIPDSVMISGAANLLDTIHSIKTKKIVVKGINKTIQRSIGLQTFKDVNMDKSRVTVVFPVEQFTEHQLKGSIAILNQPDSILLKLFPKEVSVKFNVNMSDFDKVTADRFSFYVDYADIDSLISNKLRIYLDKKPAFVKQLRYSPANVEFLIEKK